MWASKAVASLVRSFWSKEAVLSSPNLHQSEDGLERTRICLHVEAVVAAAAVGADADVDPGVDHGLQRGDTARQLAVGHGAGGDAAVGGLQGLSRDSAAANNRHTSHAAPS